MPQARILAIAPQQRAEHPPRNQTMRGVKAVNAEDDWVPDKTARKNESAWLKSRIGVCENFPRDLGAKGFCENPAANDAIRQKRACDATRVFVERPVSATGVSDFDEACATG